MQGPSGAPLRQLGLSNAVGVVVASMIGVGVFTTTGFLVADVVSPRAILLGWMIGGLLALCGALCYAELGAAYPRNGGEYRLLTEVYHPALGFMAGFVSLVVGFSAPTAAAALGLGAYVQAVVPSVPGTAVAVALVVGMAGLHALGVRLGSRVQDAMVGVQVLLIGVFLVAGFATGEPGRLTGEASLLERTFSPELAIGLVYISFSYSGWNAAAYLAGELEQPAQVLPRGLLIGTALVTLLYVLLNAVFLMSAPAAALARQVEVGHVAAEALFGDSGATALSIAIGLGLVASVSALLMTGPRVYEAMGVDYPLLSFLTVRRGRGGPVVSIVLQAALAVIMVVTASFDTLLTYIGFTLSLFAGLTAVGVVVSRYRHPGLERPYTTFGYPLTPLLFASLTSWIIGHTLWQRPVAAGYGLATLGVGFVLYLLAAASRARAA